MHHFHPFLVLLVLLGGARADMGSIPLYPHVSIFEPEQRAIIVWNGEEEILALSTDLRADKPTKILEVIPLPAKPTVEEAPIGFFARAVGLFNGKLEDHYKVRFGGNNNTLDGGSDPGVEPARLHWHEVIGAHDIAIVEARTVTGFVEWVDACLRRLGAETPTVPDALRDVIAEYIRDGYTWFAFDTVSVTSHQRTKSGIKYRFRTKALYYPLRITRSEQGATRIALIVVANGVIMNLQFGGIPATQVRCPHPSFPLSQRDLQFLGPEIRAMFAVTDEPRIRYWAIDGTLPDFHRDLLVPRTVVDVPPDADLTHIFEY